MSETPSDDSADDLPTLSRRRFVQASLAVGAGAAAVAGTSTPGRAATTTSTGRSSYTILAGDANEQTVHVYRAARDGPTTVVVGGVHGDERAGYLAADQVAEWAVDRGTLVVVPRAHPKAISRDLRPWGDDDLNRQFPPRGGDCMSTLADAIWAEVERHDPDLVLDLHSSRGIYKSGDGGVGQALFPTWTDPARTNGERTVSDLNDRFDLQGDMAYRMGNTLDADRDMLVHRVAGVLDRPGYICETTEKAPLSEQVDWHLFTVEHLMEQFGQTRSTASTTDRNEIVVQGTGSDVRYEFKATESVEPSTEPEWNDYVYSRGVNGHVSSSEDRFYFVGGLEYFEVKEGDAADIDASVNGHEISAEPDTHTIAIQGTGSDVRYEFKATESVEPSTEPEWNDYVYSRGVNGHVSSSEDRFYFVGDLEYFEVKEGDAADVDVYVDGLPLDIA